jgi:hypothetical protein
MTKHTAESSMSHAVKELLIGFSNAANKADCGTHTDDRARFFDFILKAHEEDASLDESQLNEWFVGESWPEESAFDLSCEYRFGRLLLARKEAKPYQ